MQEHLLTRMRNQVVQLGFLVGLTGCLYIPVGSLPTLDGGPATPDQPTSTVRLRAVFRNGALRTQALVTPYSRADVEHLVVTVTPSSGGGGVPILEQDLTGPAMLADIPIMGLRPDTTYRVTGRAFSRAGRDPADILSIDASSSVDLQVTRDDRPGLIALPVQLRDRTFDGQASTSVLILPGGITDLGRERIMTGPSLSLSFDLGPPRTTQVVRRPWSVGDIEYVTVIPRILVPGTGYRPISTLTGLPTSIPTEASVSLTIPRAQVAQRMPLRVGNLRHEKSYQLEAQAFNLNGTPLTGNTLLTFTVERDDRVQLVDPVMRLYFVSKPFAGSGRVKLVRRNLSLAFDRVEISVQRLVGGAAVEQLAPPLLLSRFEGMLDLDFLAPYSNYAIQARALDATGSVLAIAKTFVNVQDDDDAGEIDLEL